MSKASRILIAAIVAPLVPGIVIAAFSPKAALVAILYCYVAFLFLGLPTVFVLRRFGKLTFLSLVLSGTVAGVVSFICFSAGLAKLLDSPASTSLTTTTFIWGGVLGALVAGCFGAGAGLHNLRSSHFQSGGNEV